MQISSFICDIAGLLRAMPDVLEALMLMHPKLANTGSTAVFISLFNLKRLVEFYIT